MPYPKFEILIATRNRPHEVDQLLQSIVKSDCKPEKVILVSSGIQISDGLTTFNQELNIDHFHTETKGQVNQKKIGISRLNPNTEWVIFLDDDLLLEQNTLTNAFDTL
jgi:glycosyltransferase involved in cell wall biosynthesis